MSSRVIKNPDKTKNTSTPTNPPADRKLGMKRNDQQHRDRPEALDVGAKVGAGASITHRPIVGDWRAPYRQVEHHGAGPTVGSRPLSLT